MANMTQPDTVVAIAAAVQPITGARPKAKPALIASDQSARRNGVLVSSRA